jgi:hypothetical protein
MVKINEKETPSKKYKESMKQKSALYKNKKD